MQTDNLLVYKIEGKTFKTTEQYITGSELKKQGGIPLEAELYLAIKRPFEDELIENDTRVNLARPDIEQFFVKKKLHYYINDIEYVSYKQWISGAQLRGTGNVPENFDIYLKVDEGWQDDFIEDDELVDLARPGKERFVTRVRECTIYVKTKPYNWTNRYISYEEAVKLAFPNSKPNDSFSVSYSKGHPPREEGILVAGQKVIVKHNMEIDVTATEKS